MQLACDGDTSTNDMVSIFSTGKMKNYKYKNINDKKLKNFDKALTLSIIKFSKKSSC